MVGLEVLAKNGLHLANVEFHGEDEDRDYQFEIDASVVIQLNDYL